MRTAVIMAGLLAGCGNAPGMIDDPANPAKLGTWRVVTTAQSMTINARSGPGDGHPTQQGQLDEMGSRSTMTCGEPGIDSVEKLLAFYPQAMKIRDCSVSDMTKEGASHATVMVCAGAGNGPSPPKVTVTGTMNLGEAEASAESELYFQGVKPTGETESGTISFKHSFERIGDCA